LLMRLDKHYAVEHGILRVDKLTAASAMTVYGYTRVSTDRQATEGESLGAQKRTIEGYAMMLGVEVAQVIVERGVSGSTPLGERPGGAKLLRLLQPGDVVITPKLDRMFRSARDALEVLDRLKDEGVSLHMIDMGGDVTGNGISKLVFTILSAVAEAERDRTRERIRDVKRDQKARKRYLGGAVPFGWQVGPNKELIEDRSQQHALSLMVNMRKEGRSLRAIAVEMKAKGFKLSHFGVQKIIEAASGGDK
jgi:putative DNA-invertase from lambdoid prophage Rac